MELTDLPIIYGTNTDENIFILKDDFVSIREEYFKSIINSKGWYSLPGGVQDNFSPFYRQFPPVDILQKDMSGYKIDSGNNLDHLKIKMLPLLEMWEGRSFEINEFTICPSVTFALHVVLMSLVELGIKDVIHETPAFFSSVEQSRRHNLNTYLYATNEKNNYCIVPEDLYMLSENHRNYAIVITQPKIGIGINRTIESVNEIIYKLPKSSYLILDEAADRTSPSITSSLTKGLDNIFRVKGIFKGLGWNAVKGAIIFHHPKHKELISTTLEITGGTIDAFSFKIIENISDNTHFFKYAIQNASSYINEGVRILSKNLIGSKAEFKPLENGYIGLIKIPLNGNFLESRNRLLVKAKSLRSPIVFGSSMYFPYDSQHEWIRFNFFSSMDNIWKSAKTINELSTIF